MKWLSTRATSELFNVSPKALLEWAKQGLIQRNHGGRYLVNPDKPSRALLALAKKLPPPLKAMLPQTPNKERTTITNLRGPVDQPRTSFHTELEKWLLIPDTHVPFHNKHNFSLALRAAQSIGVTNVAILGDFADFWAVSFHSKSPSRRHDLQWEVDEVRLAFDLVDATFPDGEKKFIAGNHEYRLERYLAEKAPALFNTIRVDTLFGLKERGWAYTQYKDHTKIGNLHLTHDAGKSGRTAHVDALNAFQTSVAIGHTHMLGMSVMGDVHSKQHVGIMLGWLGDAEHCEYMYRVKAAREWAQGFGIAYVEPDGNTHVVPVPILDGRVCLEGKVIK